MKILSVACLSVLLCISHVKAVEIESSEVINAEGRVEVRKNPSPEFLKLNNNLRLAGAMKMLYGGDKLRTHTESAAELTLKDICIVGVKEDTIFEIPESIGDDTPKTLTAQQGSVLLKVVTGSDFQVRTADVIAGVKGTLFEVDVVDGFDLMLETPGLQFGIPGNGGTIVNVYEGEVELTHADTGTRQRLRKGQGIAAMRSSLLKLNQAISRGFGPMRRFDPRRQISERFGAGASQLINMAATRTGLRNFAGFRGIKRSNGNFRNRFASLLTGLRPGTIDQIQKFSRASRKAATMKRDFGELKKIVEALKGDEFTPDFSNQSELMEEEELYDDDFSELYLGENLFALCKACNSRESEDYESSATVEKIHNGLAISEGSADIKLRKYDDEKTAVEFAVRHFREGDIIYTVVKMIKGELYVRRIGDIEYQAVPEEETIYSLDSRTGAFDVSAVPEIRGSMINSELLAQDFEVQQTVSEDLEAHKKKQLNKKKDAVKKIIKSNPFKRFKF